nr:PREDICTED: basic leucine zipper transcriptional factor ATF-like 3 isoform X1 [Latimeria chalumnae]|eukprot:XP_006009276.1 PREDICTED: basic leucine zipper transcriptional factor ATF-like 3 isoform X1 [Latimeria chalumnae]
MKALEDSLDQHIVETASKRKQYPGKIVACFIKKLKAERQMLELYHPNIKPREIKADAAQGSRMTNVLAAASAVCKQTSEAMKSPEESEKKMRRREKNRVAAQRSRKKQTQKADKLHEEYECLEIENSSLKKEIGKLMDELKHLTEVLKDHEAICPLLHCAVNFVSGPRRDVITSFLPR